MMRKVVLFAVLAVSGLLLAGAGCKSESGQAAAKEAAALPEGLILDSKPADAVELVAAKESAQPGDEVVVRGRIGGRVEPFVQNRAIFQLVDSSIPTCADNPNDGCPTPWDYCCEPKDQVTAKSATVQVTGTGGKPLAVSLKNRDGLKPMADVVVRGKVADRPADGVMIINASAIYVEQ